MTSHAFASQGWVAALHDYLKGRREELAAGLEGRSYAVCEVYEDVPASVNPAPRVAIHWAIHAGELIFEECEREDVDLKLVAEWAAIEPLAKIVVADDADRAAALSTGMVSGIKSGRITVRSRGQHPAIMTRVHDDLAAMTA